MGRQEAHGPRGQAQGPPMGLSMSRWKGIEKRTKRICTTRCQMIT